MLHGSYLSEVAVKLSENGNHHLLESLMRMQLPTIKGFVKANLKDAILLCDVRLAKTLLTSGINPNWCGGTSRYLDLSFAVARSNQDIIRLLLEHGADANAFPRWQSDMIPSESYGRTALQAAMWGGDIRLMQLLLDHGADIECVYGDGPTLLQMAAKQSNVQLMQLVLEYNANVSAPPVEPSLTNSYRAAAPYRRTALQAAAERGNIGIVQLLLDHNAGFNSPATSNMGGTVLQAAAKEGYADIVRLVLGCGAYVNAPPANSWG